MIVNLTFDVEEFDFPTERGISVDFETQIAVSTDGLLRLLAVLEKHNVKATFYTTANFAQHQKNLIRDIAAAGHEIASHDYYHAIGSVLDPASSKKKLEEIAAVKITGYRSPRLAKISSEELVKAGYLYNSSMNPTWVPFRYNNLLKPRTVFMEGGLIQYPTSVSWPFRVPLFWLSLHVMNIGLYKICASSALKRDGHLNLYFHPWEFSDCVAEKRFAVPNYIARCSGQKLLNKLERLIVFLQQKGCLFQTTSNYLGVDG